MKSSFGSMATTFLFFTQTRLIAILIHSRISSSVSPVFQNFPKSFKNFSVFLTYCSCCLAVILATTPCLSKCSISSSAFCILNKNSFSGICPFSNITFNRFFLLRMPNNLSSCFCSFRERLKSSFSFSSVVSIISFGSFIPFINWMTCLSIISQSTTGCLQVLFSRRNLQA